jgi:hypothetical protein
MITKYNYLFFLSLAVLAFTSCDDKLNILPAQSIAGEVAFSTEANIQNILIGTYSEAGEDESYGGQLQIMADLLGKGDYVTWVGTFLDPRQVANKNMLTDNSFVGGYWNNAYATINQANLVLDNLDVVTSSSEERDRIEGEARFLRGLSYFDLARHFSSGDTGVPLRATGISDYSVDLSSGRASTTEIYDLVISDLQRAAAVLPGSNGIFADQYAAEALLARVYLHQGNYPAARDAADVVIMNSGAALTPTFAEAFNNDENSSEDIFAFQVTSQDGANDLIIHYADEGNGGRGGDIEINDSYASSFEGDDERGSFFVASRQTDARLTAKYTNQFGNIPLIRLAEMYLIRAEANLRESTSVGATPLADINTIRNRSGASSLDEVDVDGILLERVKELAFEGFLIHDIRRTGGSVDGFNADANELVFPIPLSEMDTNPLMSQNPGYN